MSILAIEDCLISKLSTLFRSKDVVDMNPQELSHLAGETRESSLERQRLEAKRSILRTGLQSLKSLNKRRNVVNPAEPDQMTSEESDQVSVMTPSRSEKSPVATNSAGAAPREIIPDEPSHSPDRVVIAPAVDDWATQAGYDGQLAEFWTNFQKKKKKKASRHGTVGSMFENPFVDDSLIENGAVERE